MRQVAVTEGDKVEAQIQFGWSVNGYGVGDLVERVNSVSEQELNRLMDEYAELYEIVAEGQKRGFGARICPLPGADRIGIEIFS